MTASDHASPPAGYFPSHWPGECGGPRRQKVTWARGLDLNPGDRLRATTRSLASHLWPVMFVVREPGELYLQGGTRPGQRERSFGWVEQLDPHTLEPKRRSPDLPSGGHNWCGAATVHANGDLYVVNGCYCHRLSPTLEVLAERRLPVDNAHNGHLILSDGNLVTKDIQNDPAKRSVFTVLDPELRVVDQLEFPENSVGRFSSDRGPECDWLYATGPAHLLRLRYRDAKLSLDSGFEARYGREDEDQAFAWDSSLGSDSVWFSDMGESRGIRDVLATHPIGTQRAQSGAALRLARMLALLPWLGSRLARQHFGSLHSAPLRVYRFSVFDSSDRDVLVPFGDRGGFACAPPLYDQERRILVCFDSANAKLGAWRYEGPGEFRPLWVRAIRNTNQLTVYADTGELLVDDVTPLRRWDAVVLDIESGREKGRVDTGAFISGGMWYTPGFERDFYTSTPASAIARIYA